MSRSLSLSAYLALHRGDGPADPTGQEPPRPAGPIIWVHCPDRARLTAVAALAARMDAEGDRLTMLVTVTSTGTAASAGIVVRPVPAETRAAARAFLAHWRPDLLLWMRGDLRPALLNEVAATGLPCHLIEADAAHVGIESGSWMPGLTAALVGQFRGAMALGPEAAQRLRRAGLDPDRIAVTGPLDGCPPVPPCNERDCRDLAQTIGPRPVWLAVDVPLPELDAVIQAHRQASRRAHRLLLILAPARAPDLTAAAARLRAAGLILRCRAEGEEPDDTTQVYLADGSAETGLWLRLAPLTFMGGTLAAGTAARSPLEAAALGSVVLHGTATDPHAEDYLRLSAAGASREVRSGVDLGNAVEVLLQPDRAAAMAHAAWDVTSRGAEVTNRVADLIRDTLDAAEVRG